MNKQEFVNSFKNKLDNSESFSVNFVNEYVSEVHSEFCIIRFLFDREDNDYSLEIEEASKVDGKKPMHFLLLSFLRKAFDFEKEDDTPEYYAFLMNKFFLDLLKGDFSIRKPYEFYHKDFYDKLTEAYSLPEDHPISKKISNYDISWVEDMKLQG